MPWVTLLFGKANWYNCKNTWFHVSHGPVVLDGFGFTKIIFEIIFFEHIGKLNGIKYHTT
jgi:hypothetical protein